MTTWTATVALAGMDASKSMDVPVESWGRCSPISGHRAIRRTHAMRWCKAFETAVGNWRRERHDGGSEGVSTGTVA